MPQFSLRTTLFTILLAGSLHAHADPKTPWSFSLGATHVGFSTRADVSAGGMPLPGANANAAENTTLGFEVGYALSPTWTARFLAGVPPQTTLTGTGALAGAGVLGKTRYAPAVLSLTYRFNESGAIRPYVGAGVNYTVVYGEKDGFLSNVRARNAFGTVLQVGAEVPINASMFLSLDARKIYLKTKVDGSLPAAMGNAPAHADLRLNPLIVSAMVGWRF